MDTDCILLVCYQVLCENLMALPFYYLYCVIVILEEYFVLLLVCFVALNN